MKSNSSIFFSFAPISKSPLSQSKVMLDVVIQAYNRSTQETRQEYWEFKDSLGYTKFEASLGYTARLCFKNKTRWKPVAHTNNSSYLQAQSSNASRPRKYPRSWKFTIILSSKILSALTCRFSVHFECGMRWGVWLHTFAYEYPVLGWRCSSVIVLD
jgi:hypothetical protein